MKSVFGLILGNRGFFPDKLVEEGREEILKVLAKNDCKAIVLGPKDSKFGSVVTREDIRKCVDLFRKNADKIDGIIVSLPNFGEERSIADVIKSADLRVPVLIQAGPDDLKLMSADRRRDSFCGKISACNNLLQYGIPFTLTTLHTESVTSPEFKKDLEMFKGVCNVVKGFRNLRIGAIGARPAAFNTVRYSEKILEKFGVSVETIDLSEIFGRANRLSDKNEAVVTKLKAVKEYIPAPGVKDDILVKMAKLGVVIDGFLKDNELKACAVQCWTAMEEYFGIVPCTVMSMLSDSLIPSACEVDVTGALSMYALQLASGKPSALMDWNNNYGDDPDKCVLFHCSNAPKAFFSDMRMDYQAIIAGSVGKENTYGTCVGRIKSGPATFARFTTDDTSGELLSFVGEGSFTDDAIDTFGGYGVAEIPGLQDLLAFICRNGFEHHVAVSLSSVAAALNEAFTNYLGITTYYHR